MSSSHDDDCDSPDKQKSLQKDQHRLHGDSRHSVSMFQTGIMISGKRVQVRGHVSPVGGTHSHTLYKISIVTQTLDVLLKLVFLDLVKGFFFTLS